MADYLQGDKYPGEQFSPNIKLTDEMNQTASGFLQLDAINMNNQVSGSTDFNDSIVITVYT